VLRAPLLHFIAIGAVLYVASQMLAGTQPSRVIRLDARDIHELREEWVRSAGRPPTDAELQVMIERRIDEELMLAVARELDWQRSDPIATRRLVQNQRFLDPDSEASDEELLERAFAQGMELSDIVVRRRLLERMRMQIASRAHRDAPSDDILERHRTAHPERFERPARVALDHVFLSADVRGDALARDAEALRPQLPASGATARELAALGDPFLLPTSLPLRSERALDSQFGADLAASAIVAPIGIWSGPVASSFGLHYLWPRERTPPNLPPLAAIRAEIRGDWLAEREREALREAVARLRDTARIEVVSSSPPD
jgi:hypothetical protein